MNRQYTKIIAALLVMIGSYVYGAKIYVANEGNNTVSIIDTTTNRVTGIVTDLVPATFGRPHAIAFMPDGKTAYVANISTNSVSVIDVSTDTVLQRVTDMGTFNGPFDIALTPDATRAYITNPRGNSISVVDTTTHTVLGRIAGVSLDSPMGIALTPDGTKAYVANLNSSTVSIIDTARNQIVGTVANPNFNGPHFITITSDGSTAYVTNVASISIIDVATDTVTGTVVDTVPATFNGPLSIAISPTGTTAYATNNNVMSISIIDIPSNRVVDALVGGSLDQPFDVVFMSDGSAYVTNYNGNSVSEIDSTTNTLRGTVTDLVPATFARPTFLAVVPTISVVRTSTSVVSTMNSALTGIQQKNIFLSQTEYINIITWRCPTNVTPVSYTLYRDAALTDIAGTVAATAPLLFKDHDCNPARTYTYYLVAVDQAGNNTVLGNVTINPFT